MENERELHRPNYRSRQRRSVSKIKLKEKVLSVLLSASMVMGTGYGIYSAVKNIEDDIVDAYHYKDDSRQFVTMVNSNMRAIHGTTDVFLDTFNLARDFKEVEFSSKDDVYHYLIGCARHMKYNLDENFRNFIRDLNLNELAEENSVYPTEKELFNYISDRGFYNEDGTIDFDKWRDYDKELFNAERELDDLKEGKNL